MTSSEFRATAREKLNGKWKKAALLTFGFMLFSFAVSFVQRFLEEGSFLYSIIDIAILIIGVPLSFGFLISFFRLYKGEEVGMFDYFSSGFNNFKRAWGVSWHTFLKLLVPIILMFVLIVVMGFLVGFTAAATFANGSSSDSLAELGIIGIVFLVCYIAITVYLTVLTLYYALAQLVAIDRPELSSKEAVEKSKELMKGNRGKLFGLYLSFIGWAILAAFTLGIGYLWLLPYMQFATIAFYMYLSNGNNSPEESTSTDDNPVQE